MFGGKTAFTLYMIDAEGQHSKIIIALVDN
jgi:hypothetical protein